MSQTSISSQINKMASCREPHEKLSQKFCLFDDSSEQLSPFIKEYRVILRHRDNDDFHGSTFKPLENYGHTYSKLMVKAFV